MDFLKCSRKYIFVLVLLAIVFYLINVYFSDIVLMIDEWVSNFVQSNIVCDALTNFFKVITNIGDVWFFTFVILVMLIVLKNKVCFFSMIVNLLNVYVFSVIFKNIFKRERPLYNLIPKPSDFSFPSGHTMCSVAFYGFLIYLVNRYVKKKPVKYLLNGLLVLAVIIIAFSRIYLNVHFFTDVVGGAVFGFVCLLMFINYVKIKDII